MTAAMAMSSLVVLFLLPLVFFLTAHRRLTGHSRRRQSLPIRQNPVSFFLSSS